MNKSTSLLICASDNEKIHVYTDKKNILDSLNIWKPIYKQLGLSENNVDKYEDEQGCSLDLDNIIVANKDFAIIGKLMNSVNGMYIYLELISISVSSTALYTVSTYNLSITEFTNFYLNITTEEDILGSDLNPIKNTRDLLDQAIKKYNEFPKQMIKLI